jgi:NADH-quinone oxidoreductase subunit A
VIARHRDHKCFPQEQELVASEYSRVTRRAGIHMNAYLSFLLYLLVILGFVALTLWLNSVVGPKPEATALKLEPFECGATPVQRDNTHAVPVKYYAIAVLFILFDLETVFLFLWALGAQPLSGFLLATLGLFIGLLVLIMLYVWRTGLLEEVTQ